MEQTENGAEKERNHQSDISEQVLRERKKLSSVSLMFFTISFLLFYYLIHFPYTLSLNKPSFLSRDLIMK